MPDHSSKNKILLVNLGGIGDIVMMSPVLRSVRENYPESEIDLLHISRTEEIVKYYPQIDGFFSVETEYKWFEVYNFFKALILLIRLRRKKFDYLINLKAVSSKRGEFKIRVLNKILGPKCSVGRVYETIEMIYDKTVKENLFADKSEVQYMLALLNSLGISEKRTEIFFTSRINETANIDKYLSEFGGAKKLKIVLNPGAFRPSRIWPVEYWKELIKLINERRPDSIIFVAGSKNEMGLADSLKVAGNVNVINGKFEIGEMAAFYKDMNIVISNDSGPMHLAAAAGAKVVGIFGPGDAVRFAPSVDKSKYRIARVDESPCERPCYKYKCGDPVCLSSIKPEYVFKLIEELL